MCIQTHPHSNARSLSTQSTSENNINAIISEATTTLKAEKSVSFNEVVKVEQVLHANDYTDKEKEECWFTPTDYKKIRHELMKSIKLIKCKLFTECARGLEECSDGRKTRNRRQMAIWAVLDEQYEQCLQVEKQEDKSYLIYDDVKFRKVYRRHTKVAEDIAYSMGRIDEISASASTEKKSKRRKESSISSTNSKKSTDKETNVSTLLLRRTAKRGTAKRRLSVTRHVQVSSVGPAMQA